MKLLIISHMLPVSFKLSALSYRVYEALRYLSENYEHSITMVAFKKKGDPEDYIKKYCDEIVTVEIPASFKKRLLQFIMNYAGGILRGEISLKKGNYLCYRHSLKLHNKINELLKREKFDVIFVETPEMLFYVSDINLPKVLEIWTIPQIHYEAYKKLEKNFIKKVYRLISYFEAKKFESKYENFNICITPTEQDRDIIKSYLKELDISVIPFGINCDFNLGDLKEDFPSLIFIGNMGSTFNQRSILYLYKEVYPLIKASFPGIKLYIIGKNPSEEVKRLSRDKSVIVTGYVEDIKPYLARASVVTLPVHGYGIKTRILEAMAMGKAVVTNAEGIHGLNVIPEVNIIIADNPGEFANRVIELLMNEQLRKAIGSNARKLVYEEYSWEMMSDMLNSTLQKAVNKFHEK